MDLNPKTYENPEFLNPMHERGHPPAHILLRIAYTRTCQNWHLCGEHSCSILHLQSPSSHNPMECLCTHLNDSRPWEVAHSPLGQTGLYSSSSSSSSYTHSEGAFMSAYVRHFAVAAQKALETDRCRELAARRGVKLAVLVLACRNDTCGGRV
jgi:hypothetical protein